MTEPVVRIKNIDEVLNEENAEILTNGNVRLTRQTRNSVTKVNKKYVESSESNDSREERSISHLSRRTKKKTNRKRIETSSGDDSSSEDSEVSNEPPTRTLRSKKSMKQRAATLKRNNSRKRKQEISLQSSTDNEESGQSSVEETKLKPKRSKEKKKAKKNTGRKKIKRIIDEDDLLEQTKEAAKEEQERLKRLQEREKNSQGVEEDDVAEDDKYSSSSVILQKTPLVAVSPYIARHLRPHQIEGVRFIWDNLVESAERAKTNPGGGCILAHCMGLGKTLQTIASVHTMLKNKHLSFTTALVVAPLNTVRNWVAEFVQWCEDGDELKLYNFADCRSNKERITMMREWQRQGGVLIIGYDMYRIMATKTRYKAWKTTVQECLVDPGPDIVVCDEGHMLKNAVSHISIKLNTIKTKRRLVLTGTPLQNNLIEYHCMVNFVKPDLLGSLKEFRNRFVNPIVNGQHTDSTKADVNVMKKRSHVLHQMLQGFVQRKDYSALKSYLSSKYEYVLKVRLTPLQINIYQHYLNTMTNRGTDASVVNSYGKGASLFSDYQNLMRVWTHPKSLLLHTVRKEKMEERQAANNFITDGEEETSASETDKEWVMTSSDEEGTSKNTKKSEGSKSTGDETVTTNHLRQSRDVKNNEDENNAKNSDDSIGVRKRRSKRTIMKDSSEEDRGENSRMNESDGDSSDDEKSESDEEQLPDRNARLRINKRYRLRGGDASSDDALQEEETEKVSNDWYTSLLPEDMTTLDSFENSSKITLLFEILRLAEEKNEKVLVFSQSLISLDLIEEMLQSMWKPNEKEENGDAESDTLASLNNSSSRHRTWFRNVDYFRMDGSTQGHHRQRWINAFNDESDLRARLFLISTKAGSLGVNLVGANRVVVFDASWNPTHDTQSIFRVYRFGQTKKCYIYRLIAEGTMEEKIYQRQVNKQSLSIRVVDEQQINRYFTASSLAEMYTFNPTTPESDKDKPTPVVPKDEILAELLLDPQTRHLIASYHEHDSLLDHQVDEELTEEERKAAWEEYEFEKKRGYLPPTSFPARESHMMPTSNVQFTFPSPQNLTLHESLVLMSKLNRMMQDAYIKVRSHESKPVAAIIRQLRSTPLYASTSEETLLAIAKEVNFRLSLKREEAQLQFEALQEQYKSLQNQYFQNVGTLLQNPQNENVLPLMPGFSVPSKDALLQQMAGTSTSARQTETAAQPIQTSTDIEVINISDSESTGTSSQP